MFPKILWCLFICFGAVLCQSDDSTEIPKDLADIAKNIQSMDLPINQSSMPTLEEATKIFKDKCEKNGGEGAFDRAEEAKKRVEVCLRAQVNVTEVQQEIENAKPTGDLDVVFGKYCRRKPAILDCVKNVTAALEECLEDTEKESMKVVLNVTESLADFLCHKDGDRIAMFIAEGGFDCLSEQQDNLQRCVNETVGAKIPKDMPSVDNLPLLLIGSKECDDLLTLQKCVVTELEQCKEPTPANIVESLFKFIRRVTPCGKNPEIRRAEFAMPEETSAASTNTILSMGTLLTLLVSRLLLA